MKDSYVGKLARYSISDFHVKTDIWYAAASVAVGAFAQPGEAPLAEMNASQLGWWVLIALGFYALMRLLVFAPYRIWREEAVKTSTLQNEIDQPRHIENKELARLRALARQDLAEIVRKMAFHGPISRRNKDEALHELVLDGWGLLGRAGLSTAFCERYEDFYGNLRIEQNKGKWPEDGPALLVWEETLLDYLHGRITDEDLERLLPPDTGPETQP